MSKIKVCHLYYDLMNLYGENANIRAIEKMCEYQGITCEVSLKTINDKIDFNSYDIYYMGSGDEKSELLVLEDMIKYKDKIKAFETDENKYYDLILDDIKNKINKQMPAYKYIRDIIVTDTPLIKTTTLKIKRHEEMKIING